MSTTATTTKTHLALDSIELAENVRELDEAHIDALTSSIALRGLIVPLVVRSIGKRHVLVAGYHRYAACKKLGLSEVEVIVRDQDRTSADSAAENVVRKALTPLDEARAVQHMLDEGYTLDGAAAVLGWNRKLVRARAKILELPDAAQKLIGSGQLPVGAVALLLNIATVSPTLCEAALAPFASSPHARTARTSTWERRCCRSSPPFRQTTSTSRGSSPYAVIGIGRTTPISQLGRHGIEVGRMGAALGGLRGLVVGATVGIVSLPD